MTFHMHLDKASERWTKAFPLMRGKIDKAAAAAYLAAKKPAAFRRRSFAVNVILTDDSNIKTLNKTYRGQNKPTNVLTFDSGDIILALGVVQREARAVGRRTSHHLAHLVVHGALHLRGHDHNQPGDARRMEMAETRLLHRIGVPDPWRSARRLP